MSQDIRRPDGTIFKPGVPAVTTHETYYIAILSGEFVPATLRPRAESCWRTLAAIQDRNPLDLHRAGWKVVPIMLCEHAKGLGIAPDHLE